MSKAQRVIKYLAIAFGIFLSVNIIGAIIIGIGAISGIFIGKNIGWNYKTTSYSKTFLNIEKIDIDIGGANLTVKKGTEFKIDAQNIPEKYEIKDDNGTLKISNKGMSFINSGEASIEMYIPDTYLETVKIEAGAGKINIEELKAKNIKLDLGAGNVTIDNLLAEKADISCGAGQVKIKNADLSDLDLDTGIGKLDYTGYIKGNSKINCGIGETIINLLGESNLYNINADKGIGEIEYNGKTVNSQNITTSGENKIDIEGGIGKITINCKA